MNWRHRPPRSTPKVFRFLFAMSIFIFRFLFGTVHPPRDWLSRPSLVTTCLSPAHERLPRAPVGVILLFPEDSGAHRQVSKAYPARSAALGLRRPQCYSWTSKARPVGKEANCGTLRSTIHPLPHPPPGLWQQSRLEPPHRAEGPRASGPAELSAHPAGTRHSSSRSRSRFLDLPGQRLRHRRGRFRPSHARSVHRRSF